LSAKCVRLWSMNCISSDVNYALIKDDKKIAEEMDALNPWHKHIFK